MTEHIKRFSEHSEARTGHSFPESNEDWKDTVGAMLDGLAGHVDALKDDVRALAAHIERLEEKVTGLFSQDEARIFDIERLDERVEANSHYIRRLAHSLDYPVETKRPFPRTPVPDTPLKLEQLVGWRGARCLTAVPKNHVTGGGDVI